MSSFFSALSKVCFEVAKTAVETISHPPTLPQPESRKRVLPRDVHPGDKRRKLTEWNAPRPSTPASDDSGVEVNKRSKIKNRPVKCRFQGCGKEVPFYQPVNLYHHVLEHVPEVLYPFACSECREPHPTAYSMKTHAKRVHKKFTVTVRSRPEERCEKIEKIGTRCFPHHKSELSDGRLRFLANIQKLNKQTNIV